MHRFGKNVWYTMKFANPIASHAPACQILRPVLHERPEIRPSLIYIIVDKIAMSRLILLIKREPLNALNVNYLAIEALTAGSEP